MKIRTTSRRYAAMVPLAVIALTTASVSACGGPTPLAGPSSSPPSGSRTIDVCKLLPSSQVAAVAGEKVVQAIPQEGPIGPPDQFNCVYFLSDDPSSVEVQVEETNSPDFFASNSATIDTIPHSSVPGVGDKAVASAIGLAVLTDEDNILIYGIPGDQAGAIKLARILISALG
jgi:hypothetical protein